jgi:hypothetical protein
MPELKPLSVANEKNVNQDIGLQEGFTLTPEALEIDPGFWETTKASFRLHNPITSIVVDETTGVSNEPDPEFDLQSSLTGTEFEDVPDLFLDTHNQKYFDARVAQIRKEMKDRETLEHAGVMGFATTMGASLFSPENLIPASMVARTGKLGYSTLKSGAKVASVAAGSTALAEAALQMSQQTRTKEESAVAVGGAGILGFVLGTAFTKLSNARLKSKLAKQIDLKAKIDEDFGKRLRSGELDPGEKLLDEVTSLLQQEKAPYSATDDIMGDAGAAVVRPPTLDDLSVYGRVAGGLAKSTKWLNPILRLLHSSSPAARNIAQELFEIPVYLKMNEYRPSAAAVETVARRYTDGILPDILERVGTVQRITQAGERSVFSEMIKSGVPGTNISRSDFRKKIGRALRYGDKGENEYITRAAEDFRENFFEPMREELNKIGFNLESSASTTSETYLHRIYNIPRLLEGELEFKQIAADWLRNGVRAELESSMGQFQRQIEGLSRQLTELQSQQISDLTKLIDDVIKELVPGSKVPLETLLARLPEEIMDNVRPVLNKFRNIDPELSKEVSDIARKILPGDVGVNLADKIEAGPDVRYSLPGFKSPVLNAVQNIKQEKGTPQQFLAQIKKAPGVKQDELDWMGLEDWIKGQGKSISKEDVESFIEAHQVKLDEKVLGQNVDTDLPSREVIELTDREIADFYDVDIQAVEMAPTRPQLYRYGEHDFLVDIMDDGQMSLHTLVPGKNKAELVGYASTDDQHNHMILGSIRQSSIGQTRFQENSIPGGKNYKELLIRLPELENQGFKSKHFQDQEIVHVRFDERAGPGGERILFVNEIQSDLHQAGRKHGYTSDDISKIVARISEIRKQLQPGNVKNLSEQEVQNLRTELKYVSDLRAANVQKQPQAPFKGGLWKELALKRMIKYAVDNDFDAISWARSDQIAGVVGGDAKALSVQYDQAIPKFLKKYIKKFGGKIEQAQFVRNAEESARTNSIIRLTSEMKAIKEQPLFSIGKEGPEGAFDAAKNMVYIARDAIDPTKTLRHETVHALKANGLFTDAEWKTLEQSAKEFDWLGKHGIVEKYGKNKDEAFLLEEAIADEFSLWVKGKVQVTDAIKKVFEKIHQYLEKVGVNIRKEGIKTFDDVFNRIESGEIAQRAAKEVDEATLGQFQKLIREGFDTSGPRIKKHVSAQNKLVDKISKLEEKLLEYRTFEDPEIVEDYVNEIANSIFNKIIGRADLPDIDGLDLLPILWGPLKGKTYGIPDSFIEKFLEDDIELIARKYARVVGGQVEMKKKFGSTSMKDQFEKVIEDYRKLREEVQLDNSLTQEEKNKLARELYNEEDSVIRDLEFGRDKILGRYRYDVEVTRWSRAVDLALTFNYIRALGGVLLTSATDIFRHVMTNGIGRVVGKGIVPLIKGAKAVKINMALAKKYAAIAEIVNNSRLATLADIADPHAAGTPFERFMQNSSAMFSRATGLPYWNQFLKEFAGHLTIDRIISNAVSKNLSPSEVRYMNFLGIGPDIVERLRLLVKNGDIKKIGGVWSIENVNAMDEFTSTAFWSGVSKDVNSIITTKGYGDVPVFMNRPIGKMALQFKSFAIASHQRVLIRGLQEDQKNFLSGLLGMVTIGSFIYALKQMESGREVSDNPGTWLAEGLDRSGAFSVFFELNNIAEKANYPGVYTSLAAAFPEKSQRQPASRYAIRSIPGAIAGPSFGLASDVIDLLGAGGILVNPFVDRESGLTPSDVKALRRLTPFMSLPYWRWWIDGHVVPYFQEELKR